MSYVEIVNEQYNMHSKFEQKYKKYKNCIN